MPRRASKLKRHENVPPEPWNSFLKALDHCLEEPLSLHCIGGFVVTMQFGLSRATSDIDILPTMPDRLLAQLQQSAGAGSELHRRFKVNIQPVAIVAYPEDYGSRLIRMWPGFRLQHLDLYALEAHDLALTKLERNQDVDRQDVLHLAQAHFLDAKTLRDRYVREMRLNLVSGVEKYDLTLELWIEMCWPRDKKDDGRRHFGQRRPVAR